MTRFDLGWFAGLVDAEGCLRAFCNPASVRGWLQVSMKHVPTLNKAQRIVRELVGKKPKLCPDRTNGAMRFAVQGKAQLQKLLPVLLPHLTAKRRQASVLLRALWNNDRADVELLKQLKRNPEPSPGGEGVEIRSGELTDEDIGWLAGVIDGDGCFNYGAKACGLQISNTSTMLLAKAAAIIHGVSGVAPAIKATKHQLQPDHTRPYYLYTGTRDVLADIVSAIYEHLVEKQAAALRVVLKPHRLRRAEGMIHSAK